MSLRNTESIYGLVVFTGHETKVMKNSEQSKHKASRLEVATNNSIKLIFCIEILLTLCFGIVGYFHRKGVWDYSGTDMCSIEAEKECANS